MNKKHFNWDAITSMTMKIASQVRKSNWQPDYIVGLTRGGLMPAVLLSHELGIPCETLKVALRDGEIQESKTWMAEDAYDGKKILIVDDINDTGNTLLWIQEDWRSSCYPGNDRWEDVWGNNVPLSWATTLNLVISEAATLHCSSARARRMALRSWSRRPMSVTANASRAPMYAIACKQAILLWQNSYLAANTRSKARS